MLSVQAIVARDVSSSSFCPTGSSKKQKKLKEQVEMLIASDPLLWLHEMRSSEIGSVTNRCKPEVIPQILRKHRIATNQLNLRKASQDIFVLENIQALWKALDCLPPEQLTQLEKISAKSLISPEVLTCEAKVKARSSSEPQTTKQTGQVSQSHSKSSSQ